MKLSKDARILAESNTVKNANNPDAEQLYPFFDGHGIYVCKDKHGCVQRLDFEASDKALKDFDKWLENEENWDKMLNEEE